MILLFIFFGSQKFIWRIFTKFLMDLSFELNSENLLLIVLHLYNIYCTYITLHLFKERKNIIKTHFFMHWISWSILGTQILLGQTIVLGESSPNISYAFVPGLAPKNPIQKT